MRSIGAIERPPLAFSIRTFTKSMRAVRCDGKPHLLKTVAEGRFGQVMMNPAQISVPFSAGSTNVVVSTWTFQRRTHRVTDVFFCDVTRTCTYRLIAEQITIVSP
jgi:hypothetical protein